MLYCFTDGKIDRLRDIEIYRETDHIWFVQKVINMWKSETWTSTRKFVYSKWI